MFLFQRHGVCSVRGCQKLLFSDSPVPPCSKLCYWKSVRFTHPLPHFSSLLLFLQLKLQRGGWRQSCAEEVAIPASVQTPLYERRPHKVPGISSTRPGKQLSHTGPEISDGGMLQLSEKQATTLKMVSTNFASWKIFNLFITQSCLFTKNFMTILYPRSSKWCKKSISNG